MFLHPRQLSINLPDGKTISNADKRSKYNAKKSSGYDSKKEAKRADELWKLQLGGFISDLHRQVPFILQEAFTYFDHDKGKEVSIRAVIYVADFTYFDKERNLNVIEDTKGFKTDVYMVKKKLLLHQLKDKKDYIFIES